MDELIKLINKQIKIDNDMLKILKKLKYDKEYIPTEEENYIQELLEAFECETMFIDNGIIYCDSSDYVVDMDIVERMNIDIIEGYITFYTSEDLIYIVDFINKTITIHEGALI